MSKSSENGPGEEISYAKTQAAATSILAFASQASVAIDQMMSNGTQFEDIDFKQPSNAAFNTAPSIAKLFHPDGGGLQLKQLPKNGMGPTISSPANGYYIGRVTNVEFATPSVSSDVLLWAIGLNEKTCAELNRKLAGSTVIQPTSVNNQTWAALSAFGSYPTGTVPVSYTKTDCPLCDEKPAACVRSTADSSYTFYSVLVAR